MSIERLIVITAILANCGCRVIADDLEVTNLLVVEKANIGDVVGDDATAAVFVNAPDDLLVISFSTSANLVYWANSNMIGSHIFFCAAPELQLFAPPDIYLNKRNVVTLYLQDREKAKDIKPTQGLYTYDAVMFLKWNRLRRVFGNESDQEFYTQYDLRQEPMDVCVQVRGGNIVGGYDNAKSNVVRVTAAQIERAVGKISQKQKSNTDHDIR